MAAQQALQTMGMTSAAAQRQSQVNDTNDFNLSKPEKAGAQLDKGPSAQPKATLTAPLPKTGRAGFAASKEDPKMIEKVASKNDVAGAINGMGAFIDGYLRINKRRYGSRGPYGGVSGGYSL